VCFALRDANPLNPYLDQYEAHSRSDDGQCCCTKADHGAPTERQRRAVPEPWRRPQFEDHHDQTDGHHDFDDPCERPRQAVSTNTMNRDAVTRRDRHCKEQDGNAEITCPRSEWQRPRSLRNRSDCGPGRCQIEPTEILIETNPRRKDDGRDQADTADHREHPGRDRTGQIRAKVYGRRFGPDRVVKSTYAIGGHGTRLTSPAP